MSIISGIISLSANPADMILKHVWLPGPDRRPLGSLWLGSINALTDKFLTTYNIGVVLSLCPVEQELPAHIKHYFVEVEDRLTDKARMFSLLPDMIRMIHRERLRGHNVLVHCRAGIQRAPTVVVMYLHKYYKYDVKTAILKIQKVRPIAFSNGYTFL